MAKEQANIGMWIAIAISLVLVGVIYVRRDKGKVSVASAGAPVQSASGAGVSLWATAITTAGDVLSNVFGRKPTDNDGARGEISIAEVPRLKLETL